MKRILILALVAVAYLATGHADNDRSQTRPATADEVAFCLANLDTLGPASGDCRTVPLTGPLYEDDPWGRWDCRTMGNRTCGDGAGNLTIWFDVDGELQGFDVNDPHRPGCFMEPSTTAVGYEVIRYSRISGRGAPEYIGDPLGFEIPCP